MPSTYTRSTFLKDNAEAKDNQNKVDKKLIKNQEATLEAIKKGFDTMNAGITHLITQSMKASNDTTTNSVKALELKATNEKIDAFEETIKVLMEKVEEQNNRILKLEESKSVSKELFPELEKAKKPNKVKPVIPVPQIGDNNLFNDTLNKVKVNTKKIPSYIINEEQEAKIDNNIKDKIKDKNTKRDSDKIITLDEKKKRVEKNLDKMSRTIGLRLGNDNMIDITAQAMIKYKKLSPNLSNSDKRDSAIKVLLQDFARTDLQINAEEWKKIKIEGIEEVLEKNNDVVHVTFQTHEDIAAVNSKFVNIPNK